jgi:hypothetical protein
VAARKPLLEQAIFILKFPHFVLKLGKGCHEKRDFTQSGNFRKADNLHFLLCQLLAIPTVIKLHKSHVQLFIPETHFTNM